MVTDSGSDAVAQLRESVAGWNDVVRKRLSVNPTWRADLSGADLSGADLSGADLSGADLTRANLAGANLTDAILVSADLTRAILAGADLTRAELAHANLTRAELVSANLTRAKLTRANLTRANLADANLTRARLIYTDLICADLTRAVLAETDLRDANLSGGDLIGAYLAGAYLAGAELTYANLTRATLAGANLTSAELIYANLAGADLNNANLMDADLTDADLAAANLTDAYLVRAKGIGGESAGDGRPPNLRLRIFVELGQGEPIETVSRVIAGLAELCRLAARVSDRLWPPSPGLPEQHGGVVTATGSDAGDEFRVLKAHYGSPFYVEFLQAVGPLEVVGGGALAWAVRDLTRGLEASKLINLMLTLCRKDEREAFLEGRVAERRATTAEHQAREAKADLESTQHRVTVLRLERAPTTTLAQAAAIIDPDASPDVRLETTEHLEDLQPLLTRRVVLEVVADQ